MSLKLKVIYSGIYHDNGHPFSKFSDKIEAVGDPDKMTESNSALIIWGGSDIHPDLYKRPMHPTTHPGGKRDNIEWGLVQRAIERGIPIWGICRGAQMLCAAAGGYLIQNVWGHAGWGGHDITTCEGKTLRVNSIHHQMMAGLENTEHELLAWSSERLSEVKKFGRPGQVAYGIDDDKEFVPPDGWVEPEFVYFPKINGYAIQWHPEMMAEDSPATKYVFSVIEAKEAARGSKRSFPLCVV